MHTLPAKEPNTSSATHVNQRHDMNPGFLNTISRSICWGFKGRACNYGELSRSGKSLGILREAILIHQRQAKKS